MPLSNSDFRLLDRLLSSFVDVVIETVEYRGDCCLSFQISYMEIKEQTGRSRLSQSIVEQYMTHLDNYGCSDVSCDDYSITFYLDVHNIRLNAEQSRRLSHALAVSNHLRAERYSNG